MISGSDQKPSTCAPAGFCPAIFISMNLLHIDFSILGDQSAIRAARLSTDFVGKDVDILGTHRLSH
ncbi:protein of unknown function [Burkholderia multivorans]